MPEIGPVGGPPPIPQQPHGFKDQPSLSVATQIQNAIQLLANGGGDTSAALSQINQLLAQVDPAWDPTAYADLVNARDLIQNHGSLMDILSNLKNAYAAVGGSPQTNTFAIELLNAASLMQEGNRNGALSQINQLLQQIGTAPIFSHVRDGLLAIKSEILAGNPPSPIINALTLLSTQI